jgi:hypothetical protein
MNERKDEKRDQKQATIGSQKNQGAGQQQQQAGAGQQYGEGSYSGTRQYNEGLKHHVENHDIEREARDAEPRSAAEEREMQEAERVGRSKARGGDESSLEGNNNPGESDDGEK